MADSVKLPTEKDLKKLSPRARAAYAARCARRVQPLYTSADPRHIEAVENAIAMAERFAGGACAVHTAVPDAYAAAIRAATAAGAAYAAYAADAAAALGAALGAADADAFPDVAYAAAVRMCNAADAAARAYAARTVAAGGVAVAATRAALAICVSNDYRRLLGLSPARGRKKDRPVDVATLGPLWPDGEPDWYTRAVKARQQDASSKLELDQDATVGPPALVIAYDPDLVSEDDYKRLVAAIGDIVRSEGGAGLKRLKSRGYGVRCGEGVLQ